MPPHHPDLPPPLGDFVLREEERPLVASLDRLDEAVLITRAELDNGGPTIIGVSPGIVTLTRYSPNELIGRTPRIFQGPLTERAVLDRLVETCKRGESFVGETVNYRKDGSSYLLRWTIDPIRDATGRVTHFFSLQHDATNQHAFAKEWLAAEERSRTALAQVSAQMALIAEAILVLEKTKRSFRSKELGQLRERLMQVGYPSRPQPPTAGR